MESPSESILLTLNNAIRRDYRESIVKHILENYKQAVPVTRQRLEKALQAHVKIRGFRNPLQAPMVSLVQAVVARSSRSTVVLGALLYVWGELHADLREATYNFLRMQGISVLQAICLEGNFAENWSLPKISEMAGVFQAQYPGFNIDDVVLMLCCLTGQAPLPAHGEKSLSKEGATTKWQQWLEELYALPADALEWDTVTDLVETVKQLGEAKRKEREAARNSLRAALKTLVTDTQQELAFFGMVDVPSWNSEACALTEVAALTQQVEQLYASLVEYRSVYQRSMTTLTEELQRREALVPLEAAIQQAYRQLVPVFTAPLARIIHESKTRSWDSLRNVL